MYRSLSRVLASLALTYTKPGLCGLIRSARRLSTELVFDGPSLYEPHGWQGYLMRLRMPTDRQAHHAHALPSSPCALLPVAHDATLPTCMRAVRLGRGRDMDFLKDIEWPMWFGYAAVVSSVLTCAMKTMIPLRVVSMVCNSFFIVYGLFGAVYPTLLLNLILLPLNSLRLLQMQRLIRDVEAAASYGDTSIDWLPAVHGPPFRPQGRYRVPARARSPTRCIYSVSGRYRLREMELEIPNGQVFGELGLLSPSNLRTQTVECTEDGEVLAATYLQVRELYFQNPQFGFYFLRLTSERLFQNIERLEQELVRKNEEIAALAPRPA